MRKALSVLLVCSTVLVGCSEETVPVTETPELRQVMDGTTWDGYEIPAITPVTSFAEDGDALLIYPYNNSDKHISLRRIVISSYKFWDTVEKTFDESNIKKKDKSYSLVTNNKGITTGYLPISANEAYLVTTEDLPSSYVEAVLDSLCEKSNS